MGGLTAEYGALLNAPTVQKELNLTDDEKTAIKGILEKARSARRYVGAARTASGRATGEDGRDAQEGTGAIGGDH